MTIDDQPSAAAAEPGLRLYGDKEQAKVIRIFLDIIYGKVLRLGEPTIDVLRNVCGVMQKYECLPAQRTFRYALCNELHNPECDTLRVFLVAASLQDIDICTLAIRKSRNFQWPVGGEGGEEKKDTLAHFACIDDPTVFDLPGITLDTFERTPARYVLAYLRAEKKARSKKDKSETFAGVVADEFKRLMEA